MSEFAQVHREAKRDAVETMESLVALEAERPLTDEEKARFEEAEEAGKNADAALSRIEIAASLEDDQETRVERVAARGADRRGLSVDEATQRRRDVLEARHVAMFGGGQFESEEQRALVTLGRFDSYVENGVRTGGISNVLTTGTDAAGGYLVEGDEIEDLIEEYSLDYSLLELCDTQTVPVGRRRLYGVFNDTGVSGEDLDENAQATSADPDTGQVSVSPRRYSSKIIDITRETLEDSPWRVQAAIEMALMRRIMRRVDIHLISGTSTRTPEGVVGMAVTPKADATTDPVVSGISEFVAANSTSQATAIKEASIRAMYRFLSASDAMASSTRWVSHQANFDDIFMLEDGNNNRIFRNIDFANRLMSSILGIETRRIDHVPEFAANAYSLYLVNLMALAVRWVRQVRFAMFADEKAYEAANRLGFLAQTRVGGKWAGPSRAGVRFKNAASD